MSQTNNFEQRIQDIKKISQTSVLLKNILQKPFYYPLDQIIHVLKQIHKETDEEYEQDFLWSILRIKGKVNFSPPTSEVVSLTLLPQSPPILHVSVNTLTEGVQGPLPTPYTEILHQQNYHRNYSINDFLDIFNHRFLSLKYLSNAKFFESIFQKEAIHSTIGQVKAALCGFSFGNIKKNTLATISDTFPFFHLLWSKKNALGLCRWIKTYFGIHVCLNEFQGKWNKVNHTQYSLIGQSGQHQILGKSIILGKKTWNQGGGFLLKFAATSWERAVCFLPICHKEGKIEPGEDFIKLRQIIRHYIGPLVFVRIDVQIYPHSLPLFRLNSKSFLGFSTWLRSTNQPVERAKVSFFI